MPKLMSFSGAHWKNRRMIRRSTMAEAGSPGERMERQETAYSKSQSRRIAPNILKKKI